MADIENLTPFNARIMPSLDRDGRDVLLIVVSAQFVLPEPGDNADKLRLTDTQEAPPMSDDYYGEPGRSSVRREGQSPYTKPATDVYVCGEACAPDGRPVLAMNVAIRVGPCTVDLRVHGDRTWQRAVTLGVSASAAQSFITMPLVWERAYGGVSSGSTAEHPMFEPHNPVGCGFETDPDAAIGKPLPNIEDPRQPLQRVSDRPHPAGVGPIARHWWPRVKYAGTYDDAWRRTRAPLWPIDFDERFFCGAPPSLQAFPHLVGGEPVLLRGLHPTGPIQFRLPAVRLATRSHFTGGSVESLPTLDGVLIETAARKLTMYYRTAVPAPLSVIKHRETSLRVLRSGEERFSA
jgi:hypothetical protein